jgi:hypothetical protein
MFGSFKFGRDMKRPTRLNNEAKRELDRYADALAADPTANSVVVWVRHHDGKQSEER